MLCQEGKSLPRKNFDFVGDFFSSSGSCALLHPEVRKNRMSQFFERLQNDARLRKFVARAAQVAGPQKSEWAAWRTW
jgi:hypothetical protein